MKRTLWQDLVVENPMLIEIRRFQRRFFKFSSRNTMNSAVLALSLIAYVGILGIVFRSSGDIPPSGIIIYLQTPLFVFFAPGMLHGAIAGERERRSWDLLLVAPVTKAQIVAGKYIGALSALGFGALLMLGPVVIAAARWSHTNWYNLFLVELVSLSFLAAECALTILISARVKRAFVALGTTLGTMIMLLIVIPIFAGMALGGNSGNVLDLALFLHPFMAMTKISGLEQRYDFSNEIVANMFWGWPQILIYLFLAGVLIFWAGQTLTFAENDVKFLPQGHKDA